MSVAWMLAATPAASGAVSVPSAFRSARSGTVTKPADPNAPVLVANKLAPPSGYVLTAAKVERIAARVVKVRDVVRRHKGAYPAEYTKGPGRWQVSWFTRRGKEIAQVYVDDRTARVTEAWTGFQVAWTMARGYAGAFGRRVNAWYVWLPMCLMFVAPFFAVRRRPTLVHLDLLALLGFSVSLALFNHARIGLSVPLVYPFLVYLLVRMVMLGLGRGRPRAPLRLNFPVAWLAIATIFLVGFRIGLNMSNSNVIDVGYAGVIGADKLIKGQKLYGHWPSDNANGDTYAPATYYAYVPFRAAFGWSGLWDDLPAAHAAAIAFDLLTLLGLFLLGRQIRGPTLGTALAYGWAAYPFTLYALESNSNDTLVAALLVFALLAVRSSPGRGVLAALAGLTKFAPLALGPLLMRGTGRRATRRAHLIYAFAFAVVAALAFLPVVLDGNLSEFWKDSIKYQADRPAPFSIWGLWGGLSFPQHVVQGAAVAFALVLGFRPRIRTTVQIAALAAAVLIALQLGVTYWFYLYIVWFTPLVLIAVLGSHPEPTPLAAATMAPQPVPVAINR
jgi:hypothetical protein